MKSHRVEEDLEIGMIRSSEVAVVARMSRDLIERGLGWTWGPARIARCVASADYTVIVARFDAKIAGFAIMQFGQDTAHLVLFAVAPEFRRRGVARALFAWLERAALYAGVRVITLEVRRSAAPARGLYRALGFEPVEVKVRYYQGREDALRMALRIAPEPEDLPTLEEALGRKLTGG